ncbi:MAG: hypothetical protein AEth_00377 [Candidatus Argoarchaeum ethanivorans]|uniref:Uncharacterized protein n=1 Tax=Candidatus Argoarchaeum ethanivorans TaxID=2608793 RepID=A0A8B3S450_9EURY|nr:MAG: hypothetical protein AEth_00377 [Candidatus Argoarchaeum ethanivorans]
MRIKDEEKKCLFNLKITQPIFYSIQVYTLLKAISNQGIIGVPVTLDNTVQ